MALSTRRPCLRCKTARREGLACRRTLGNRGACAVQCRLQRWCAGSDELYWWLGEPWFRAGLRAQTQRRGTLIRSVAAAAGGQLWSVVPDAEELLCAQGLQLLGSLCAVRSEERRVGKTVELGVRRMMD